MFLNLNLRKLILILTILSVSCLFLVSLFILNYVVKQQLIQNSLSINEKYSSKIATGVNRDVSNMLQELQYSSKQLGQNFSSTSLRQAEVKRLKNQSNNFNSVFIVDQKNHIVAYAPSALGLKFYTPYTTLGIVESLKIKKTYISAPYWSSVNNLVVLMSQPIYDVNQNYKGFISGTIYLQKKNLISEMLFNQFDFKKSYMYVIDQQSRIIFHPDPSRIGEKIINNSGLNYINENKSGSVRLSNSLEVDNLAGFAHVPSVNWIVVSQQPTDQLLEEANALILKVSIGIFIFYLFIFFIVWRISHFISSPLNHLAKMASMLSKNGTQDKISQVDPWYFEVFKFRTSLLLSSKAFDKKVSELRQHINIDPLTGLYNRRGMQYFLDELISTNTHFAVLAIDIDFFKKINDTYGHDRGDEVLKRLALLMQQNFRSHDFCCRTGGEEFIVLMMTSDVQIAFNVAERLRKSMQASQVDEIEKITISVGIAFWPIDSKDIKQVCRMADNKLYEVKNNGRNHVRMTQNLPKHN